MPRQRPNQSLVFGAWCSGSSSGVSSLRVDVQAVLPSSTPPARSNSIECASSVGTRVRAMARVARRMFGVRVQSGNMKCATRHAVRPSSSGRWPPTIVPHSVTLNSYFGLSFSGAGRIGWPAASSLDTRAGNQSWRMKVPITVPGPTRVSSSLSALCILQTPRLSRRCRASRAALRRYVLQCPARFRQAHRRRPTSATAR